MKTGKATLMAAFAIVAAASCGDGSMSSPGGDGDEIVANGARTAPRADGCYTIVDSSAASSHPLRLCFAPGRDASRDVTVSIESAPGAAVWSGTYRRSRSHVPSQRSAVCPTEQRQPWAEAFTPSDVPGPAPEPTGIAALDAIAAGHAFDIDGERFVGSADPATDVLRGTLVVDGARGPEVRNRLEPSSVELVCDWNVPNTTGDFHDIARVLHDQVHYSDAVYDRHGVASVVELLTCLGAGGALPNFRIVKIVAGAGLTADRVALVSQFGPPHHPMFYGEFFTIRDHRIFDYQSVYDPTGLPFPTCPDTLSGARAFAGTWTYQRGSQVVVQCPGRPDQPIPLDGTTITLTPSDDATVHVAASSGGCAYDYSVRGGVATVVPGQRCETLPDGMGGTTTEVPLIGALALTGPQSLSDSAQSRIGGACTATTSGTAVRSER